MKLRSLASICLFAVIFGTAAAQTAEPRPSFEITDVHPSPRRVFPIPDGGVLRGDRYIIRQVSIVDLIVAAYGTDAANVQGGPQWLEMDRFDIIAKTAPGTSAENIKLMLQSLLADRFKLVMHNGEQAASAYALTVTKDKPKMKESATDAAPDCNADNLPATAEGISNIKLTCHNMTMDGLATMLHQAAGGYLHNPVVDSTGVKGSFDFELAWTPRGQLAKAGSDGISIFDAVEKQLGLKLTLKTSALPAMIVDSVTEQPAPNAADLAAKLPPLPPPAFDVAVIKPNKSGTQDNNIDISGSQLRLQNVPLKLLIAFAWDLNPNDSDVLVGPDWLNSEKFDVLAKASNDVQVSSSKSALSIDPEDLREMLRTLLTERFQIKSHMEDRTISTYTLMAASPKLHEADPTSRTHCINGPGPGEKDPTITNPALNRVIHCQNITMVQFGDELQKLAGGYIYGKVPDSTGLTGGWDFTLSFSGAGQLQTKDHAADNGASDPNGALSLMDAMSKELGLKLEKQRRPVPVLVIDNIQQKPTEN